MGGAIQFPRRGGNDNDDGDTDRTKGGRETSFPEEVIGAKKADGVEVRKSQCSAQSAEENEELGSVDTGEKFVCPLLAWHFT